MRLLLLVLAPMWTWAQAPVPTERREDTYAVYSAMLANPSMSQLSDNKKYLIQTPSGSGPAPDDLGRCVQPPEADRDRFKEVQEDYSAQAAKRYRLDREFRISKAYDLVTEDKAAEFQKLRGTPNRSTDEVELFRGARDLIMLGNVYFDRKRTLAAVYIWGWCGSLCGYGSWRIFARTAGGWTDQDWSTCFRIAELKAPATSAAGRKEWATVRRGGL